MAGDATERLRTSLADRYTIERELGAGGMATVYLARDLKHERRVALKVLRPELSASLGPTRFLHEIRVTANLQHPHILPLLDSGEVGGELFYVMPFVEGESLRVRLARDRELPVADAVRILREVADALAYAHQHGVVHRDIKPDNILLSGRHALVTDFGVAKALSEATGRQALTTAGIALGTPSYMAPEQAAADPHVDHRADIYALGVVAYELLAGAPPFSAPTAQEVLAAHVTQAPAPVTERRAAVPPALASVVMRCLEKRPADRWQGADELVTQLELIATPSGGMEPTSARPGVVAAPRWRRRGLAIGAIALAVVGAAAAIGLALKRPAAEPDRRRVVVLPFETRGSSAELRDAGALAADRIEQGITQASIADLLPWRSTEAAAASGGDPAELRRRVARATGAGTLIVGSIYERGDSVEAQAQVLDARDLLARFTVRSTADDAQRAIEGVQRRVLGAVAAYVDREFASFDITQYAPPPSLEAYRAYRRGFELFAQGRFREAIPNYEQAFAADTNWIGVLGGLWASHFNLGENAQADSLKRYILARRDRLTAAEAAQADWAAAWLDGSPEQEYHAATEGSRLDPRSWDYGMLVTCVRGLRPREGIRRYEGRDTSTTWSRDWVAWRSNAAAAYHMLGENDRALRVVREGRAQNPQSSSLLYWEARLHAAKGRFDELDSVLGQSLSLGSGEGTPAIAMRWAGRELVAHGRADRAPSYFQRALEWNRTQSAQQQAQSQAMRGQIGLSLYFLERWAESESVYTALAAEAPDNVGYKGRLGVLAARQGRREAALEAGRQLRGELPSYLGGDRLYWAARIMSVLGEKDQAVVLLRQALDHGSRISDWHTDSDLMLLRGHRPFEELVRLRD